MQALVQLRGEINMSEDVHDTLKMLNVHAVNHCTFVPETETYRGMVTKVHDHVAYGEPSQETVELLLSRRAEPIEGDTDIDDEWVEANTEYTDVSELAAALLDEETTLRDAGLSPAIRLHPPRSGHDGVKHPTAEGGQIGKHDTEAIDELLTAMR